MQVKVSRKLVAAVIAVAVCIARILYQWYLRRQRRPFVGKGSPAGKAIEGGDEQKGKQRPLAGSRVPQKAQLFVTNVKAKHVDLTEEESLRIFPRRFECHDHVVVAKMNDGVDLEKFLPTAEAFALCFSPQHVDVIIVDTEGISGELRKPVHQVVYERHDTNNNKTQAKLLAKVVGKRYKGKTQQGDVIDEAEVPMFEAVAQSPTFTVHIENGVRYTFDVMKVMFCSGNTTERMHFANIKCTDETCVDMFAGIGYFSLPLAMHGEIKALHALEKNPDSCAFLRFNALLNGVGDRITIYPGDNRVASGDSLCGQCDRVLMGYIPSCQEFIPRAYSFLKKNESGGAVGVIHYHFLSGAKQDAPSDVVAAFASELGASIAEAFVITELRQVKSYAPKIWHYVADVTFGC